MAENRELVKDSNGQWQIKGRPRETFRVLSHNRPSNIPGKSLITGIVDMPPDAITPPHKHGGAAVIGLTINGTLRNQMNTSDPIISKSGEIWFEDVGCHHVLGENVSKTEGASFFAVFVVDDEIIKDGYQNLVVMDADKET